MKHINESIIGKQRSFFYSPYYLIWTLDMDVRDQKTLLNAYPKDRFARYKSQRIICLSEHEFLEIIPQFLFIDRGGRDPGWNELRTIFMVDRKFAVNDLQKLIDQSGSIYDFLYDYINNGDIIPMSEEESSELIKKTKFRRLSQKELWKRLGYIQ